MPGGSKIKKHEEITEYFVKQATIGSENGVAPLDANCKIPYVNLPFGIRKIPYEFTLREITQQ